jgi:DNA repair photolyase
VLEVLREFRHPVCVVTKSALIQRDIDILAEMAASNLAAVAVSITTLDRTLARHMEPRAATPPRRLETVRALAAAGIPVSVLASPMIPALNDHELERILEAAREAGAVSAGYILLRLPLELTALFEEWLEVHAPGKAKHVMSLIRQARDGKTYRADWGKRMTGTGAYAELLGARFAAACRRLGLNERHHSRRLDTSQFRRPPKPGDQLALF